MRTKSETKRRQILTIAGNLFREHGFGAVNMAQIAASVGGSKSTLYNHFPSKEALFEAYVIEAGREPFAALADSNQAGDNVEKSLTAYARAYLRLLLSPEVLAINRLVIAEAPRFQELGRIFYQNGPRATLDQIEKSWSIWSNARRSPSRISQWRPYSSRQWPRRVFMNTASGA